jgi:hypothetical protein
VNRGIKGSGSGYVNRLATPGRVYASTERKRRLLIKLHEQTSQEVTLVADAFTIGRKGDNDPAVSCTMHES